MVRVGDTVVRGPFWANAVTQGRVAAASILGLPVDAPVVDHYFWTEIASVPIKVVGPLPLGGEPQVLEDAGEGAGLLAWGSSTVAPSCVSSRSGVPADGLGRDLARRDAPSSRIPGGV